MASIKRIDIVKSNVLEAKLELLHNCMAFTTEPELSELLTVKHKDHYAAFTAAIAKLKEENNDFKTDGTDRKHIDALTVLRKELLGS